MARRGSVRVSDSIWIGPIRLRISAPVNGRGRVWGSVGTRTRGGFVSLSKALARQRRP